MVLTYSDVYLQFWIFAGSTTFSSFFYDLNFLIRAFYFFVLALIIVSISQLISNFALYSILCL